MIAFDSSARAREVLASLAAASAAADAKSKAAAAAAAYASPDGDGDAGGGDGDAVSWIAHSSSSRRLYWLWAGSHPLVEQLRLFALVPEHCRLMILDVGAGLVYEAAATEIEEGPVKAFLQAYWAGTLTPRQL